MFEQCINIGGMIPGENGPEHICSQFGRCSFDERKDLKHCTIDCSKYKSIRDRGPCMWRGEVMRLDEANLCGMRGQQTQIFSCELHSECSHGRYCDSQKVRTCLNCSDHEEPQEELITVEGERHLIYHIWPKSVNGVWQWNVEQLLERIHQFDGTRTIGIATSADADSVADVKAAFSGHRIDNWIIRDNDRSRGESVTFRRMLQSLPRQAGVTFYGHAKGVQYPEENSAVKIWTEIMYESLLEDPIALESTEKFSTVGCFRQNFHSAVHQSKWHFAGTFFWFRNEVAFSRPEWKSVIGGYYAVELWPGRVFAFDESFNVFGKDSGKDPRSLYDVEVMRDIRTQFDLPDPRNGPFRSSISIVIASLGRATLEIVVDQLQKQLGEDDEIIIVADGEEALGKINAMKLQNVRIDSYHDHRSAYGNGQKRHGQTLADKDLVWFVDDDDCVTEMAIRLIKAEFENLRSPVVFRIWHEGKIMPSKDEIVKGKISSPCLVVPNEKDCPLFPGDDVYESDFEWISAVNEWQTVRFSKSSIYECNEHRCGK